MSATTGRRRHQPERKALVGARMRMAAEQAGYTTTVAMGEALGWPSSTISRYWLGRQTPNIDALATYADAVGKPIYWFFLEGTNQELNLLGEALLGIINEVMDGRDAAAAHAAVTGDPGQFGARERAELEAGTPALREAVTQEAGRDWQRTTPRQRRRVVARLAARALREQGA